MAQIKLDTTSGSSNGGSKPVAPTTTTGGHGISENINKLYKQLNSANQTTLTNYDKTSGTTGSDVLAKASSLLASQNSGGTPTYVYPQIASTYDSSVDYTAQALESALQALKERLNAQTSIYEQQLKNYDDEYEKLIDQNEVSRYKAKGAIREALANRGQLDSGYGRQEVLNSELNFANATNDIKLQRQNARDTINNAIAQLKAQYESDKSNLYAKY